MVFPRILNLPHLLKQKSFFLFGPRSTGKTTLIKEQLKEKALYVNLLEGDQYFRFSAERYAFRELVLGQKARCVVVDEVQKIPDLLDEVHSLIESTQIRFLLTGSSARKLKRGHANLLAGRAWTAEIFPLVSAELGRQFNLEKVIRFGSLPQVYTSSAPHEELKAYTRTYLYEEIQAEGIVRKIPQFSRFLRCSALNYGNLINYARLASDTGVPASTLKEHYQILEDTLIGFSLQPWRHSRVRKAVSTAKFYFFDNGVTHALSGTKQIDRNSDLFGRSFEQWIINEVRAYLSYRRKDDELSFWRTKHGDEVDLIVGDHTAIEIKATQRATQRDARGLERLKDEKTFKNYRLITQDRTPGLSQGVQRLYFQDFLKRLWNDEFF